MWLQKYQNQVEKKTGYALTAVAIDKDKNSQNALKWAIDNLLLKGQTVVLIHVKLRCPNSSSLSLPKNSSSVEFIYGEEDASLVCIDYDPQTKELFVPFRCFSILKDINCKDVVLEDTDIAKAIIEYAAQTTIENLVLGASSKGGFLRFKATNVPGAVSKGAPDFCNVYIISKGKIQSKRSALRPAPAISPLRLELYNKSSSKPEAIEPKTYSTINVKGNENLEEMLTKSYQQELTRKSYEDVDYTRFPFTRRNGKSYAEISLPDADLSFVSSGRAIVDHLFPSFYDSVDSERSTPLTSNCKDTNVNHCFDSMPNSGIKSSIDVSSDYSAFSHESGRLSIDSMSMEDMEAEMKRLKFELKQTKEMYSSACKEAHTAKQRAQELQRWKMKEDRRLEKARLAEGMALAIVENERVKSKAALKAAKAARRIAKLEIQKRINVEMKTHKATTRSNFNYRKYTIEEIEEATKHFASSCKIGEGGYGTVYNGYLDHNPVTIKVLRLDAAHGREQFQQEIEILSYIRHPNMVLLLGACPESGCLVYEFMENGSLEDRLFCRGNTPPLSWKIRFKIAAEIGTGLLFLHQTKPEPLVHSDLKPANILLDCNFVSKINDVGLARLVPPSVADDVTQYRITSTADTFCYIDPEYQQTGMLDVKSDIYSLGVLFLQLITAKSAMGLTYHVESSIDNDTFAQMLDPTVQDWPVEEALAFAKLSLKCAELRRKDRPDLSKVILPKLNKLRELAEDHMHTPMNAGHSSPTSNCSQISVTLEDLPGLGSPIGSRYQSLSDVST